ncbi:MAG: hypothetical protein COA86_17915 [Kangiella sp.]|nr:MAG: hypothetical protein COA86_17915 [Kangiella sp.]
MNNSPIPNSEINPKNNLGAVNVNMLAQFSQNQPFAATNGYSFRALESYREFIKELKLMVINMVPTRVVFVPVPEIELLTYSSAQLDSYTKKYIKGNYEYYTPQEKMIRRIVELYDQVEAKAILNSLSVKAQVSLKQEGASQISYTLLAKKISFRAESTVRGNIQKGVRFIENNILKDLESEIKLSVKHEIMPLVKAILRDVPNLSAKKIADHLVSVGYNVSTSTVRDVIRDIRKPTLSAIQELLDELKARLEGEC